MGMGAGIGVGVDIRVGAGITSPTAASLFKFALNKGADARVRSERDDFCFKSVILFLRLMVRSGWLRLSDEAECIRG